MTEAAAQCQNCQDLRWVCENHINRPWAGLDEGATGACDCGAGQPCADCNTSSPPDYGPGVEVIWSLKDFTQ